MKRRLQPDYHTRRSRARSDVLAAAGWFEQSELAIDADALKAELLDVFDRYVPREEPKSEGE